MQVLLHPSDRPVFRLRGSSAQCLVEIRVNDVPIHRHGSGTACHFDLAINEWLFQGPNSFDIRLMPLEEGAHFPPGASFEAKLACKAAREVLRHSVDLGELTWKPTPEAHAHLHAHEASHEPEESPDDLEEFTPLLAFPGQPEDLQWSVRPPKKLSEHGALIHATLPMPPPWPACPWLHGGLPSNQTGIGHAVTSLLRTLHACLQRDGWRDLMKRRIMGIQAAYYLSPGEVDEALGFPALLEQPDWTLQPLPGARLAIEKAGHGKLVRLVDSETNDSAIVLTNDTLALSATIDAWWMLDGEWSVIR